jgi:hypothetical protein
MSADLFPSVVMTVHFWFEPGVGLRVSVQFGSSDVATEFDSLSDLGRYLLDFERGFYGLEDVPDDSLEVN